MFKTEKKTLLKPTVPSNQAAASCSGSGGGGSHERSTRRKRARMGGCVQFCKASYSSSVYDIYEFIRAYFGKNGAGVALSRSMPVPPTNRSRTVLNRSRKPYRLMPTRSRTLPNRSCIVLNRPDVTDPAHCKLRSVVLPRDDDAHEYSLI